MCQLPPEDSEDLYAPRKWTMTKHRGVPTSVESHLAGPFSGFFKHRFIFSRWTGRPVTPGTGCLSLWTTQTLDRGDSVRLMAPADGPGDLPGAVGAPSVPLESHRIRLEPPTVHIGHLLPLRAGGPPRSRNLQRVHGILFGSATYRASLIYP